MRSAMKKEERKDKGEREGGGKSKISILYNLFPLWRRNFRFSF